MKWYEAVIAAHRAVTDAVSHGGRMESSRYFVWQEDGQNDYAVAGRHGEQAVTGTTDLFTKQEFDPWKEQFEAALDASPYLVWRLNSVQFEADTLFWHYEWVWEVSGCGEDDLEG